MPREPLSGRTLAWIGTGMTVIALAFTVRPVEVPAWVFWVVVGVGAIVIAIGCGPLMRVLYTHVVRDGVKLGDPSRRARVARECRRVQAAMRAFAEECEHRRPRGMFAGGSERIERWREETAARYRVELRGWVSQVFAEAVACDAALESVRPLVEAPSPTHLGTLGDVFGDAAEQLERPGP